MSRKGVEKRGKVAGDRSGPRQGRARALALAVFAALYVISPVDLIPDVPVLGWVDDLLVLLTAGSTAWRGLRGGGGGRFEGLWSAVTRLLWGLLGSLVLIVVVALLL